jgi:S-adenosylmethionine hydrolase
MALPITFLSDYGLRDEFVGVVHAVIARIAPAARVIDLTHGIPRQDVETGARVLERSLAYAPAGVHLAVVDPEVGARRRAVALRTAAEERLLVGPDNGLLLPAAETLGGLDGAWLLENERYRLHPTSRTFHGRDVFSPAAAHLALGLDPAELGSAIDVGDLVRSELPQPEIGGSRIQATVLYVDRFGNVALNLRREHAAAIDVEPGVRVELAVNGESYFAETTHTFADAQRGELILFEDSYGSLAVAITGGDAAATLRVRSGDAVRITRC